MSQKIKTSVEIDGSLTASQIANATTDTDKFLVSDGGTVKYRTGAELVSDLGITSGTASHVQHQVKAGVAINKGQAVYVTGADGTNMIVGLASNASEATSSKTMGLLNATVSANGFADVITEGLLAGLNTIGANAGDPVWLGTGGNLIYGLVNKPYAPNHLVFIGIVTRVNANNGEIFVKVQNGFELEELHNVLLTGTQNNQLLAYNSSTGLWENKSIGTVLGGTNAQYVKGDGSFSSALNSRIEVNFIATAGQTTFSTPYEIGQIEVYYNGSKLYPDEFIATNGTSVVLVNAATLNAQISIVKYVSTFTTTSIRNETIFTTTSGQTTFSVNYAVGQVDVFYNGAKLNPSEFTATNGTSIILGFACAAGESISVISYVNQVSGANGTANKVAKFTGVASLGDSKITDNGTNVGIDNSNPLAKLVVSTASNVNFEVRNGADYGLTGVGIDSRDDTRSTRNAMFIYGSPIVLGGGNVLVNTTTDAGYKLDVNGTSRFASVQTGSAGVLHPTTNTGTNASPSYENLISYTSSAVGTSQILGSNYLGSSYGTGIQFRVNSEYYANDPITAVTIRGLGASAATGLGTSSPTSKLEVASGDIKLTDGFKIGWRYAPSDSNMYDYISNSYDGASVGSGINYRGGSWTGGDIIAHSFYSYWGGDWVERITIRNSGAVSFNHGGGFRTAIQGNNQINTTYNGGGTAMYLNFQGNGAIYAGSSYAVLYAGSDRRIKTDIKDAESTLEKILNLTPRTFRYKERPNDVSYGFIAQEVEEVMPEIVKTSEGISNCAGEEIVDQKSIESYGLAWASILVKAMQEQNIIIQELKAEIEILKNK